MMCYLPWLRTVALSALAIGLIWHNAIGHALAVLGLVVGVILAAAVAAVLAALVIRVARRVQRRRALAGGCTTCRHPCQRAMTAEPVLLTLAPAAAGEPAPAGAERVPAMAGRAPARAGRAPVRAGRIAVRAEHIPVWADCARVSGERVPVGEEMAVSSK
jgi:hypothetical protein